MAFAPLIVGRIYDKSGTYEPAFKVMALLMAVTIVLYLSLGRYRFAKNLTLADGSRAEMMQPGAPD